jgi:hypothetical protein
MIIKIATCLLAVSFLAACQTTQSTAGTSSRQNLQERMVAQNSTATNPNSIDEAMPPAEGPEDVPGEGPIDPNRNPGLLPTPLLRANAAGGL